jgi:hypothetical protein
MLVNNPAVWREKTFPAPFPCLIRKVRIFDIEWVVERIEPSNFQVSAAIEGTRTSACPKDGHGAAILILREDVIVPEIKKSALKPAAGLARFHPSGRRISEKDLRCYGKNRGILETIQQRSQKVRIHNHVVIEQNHNIRAHRLNTTVIAANKVVVSFKRKNPDLRKPLPDELDASIGAAVVYDKDFMIAALVLDGSNHMG